MAIAYDASSGGTTSGTSLTIAHTCTGSDLILVVVTKSDGANTVTGVTYDGVAMTNVSSFNTTNNYYGKMWILTNPSTGNNDIVITSSDSRGLGGAASSFTGAKQSNQPDANDTATWTATSMPISVTTTANGCWTVMGYCGNRNVSAGASTTVRIDGASSFQTAIGDSNAAITPAGSNTLTMTQSDTATASGGIFSISPVLAAIITDTLYIGDSLTASRRFSSTITDILHLGDSLTAVKKAIATITDILHIGDLISRASILWSRRTKPTTTYTNRTKPTTNWLIRLIRLLQENGDFLLMEDDEQILASGVDDATYTNRTKPS